MGIKPTSGNHVVIPPDNTQSRWGEWEAELDNKGEVAGEVITETWALADSANKVASKALSDAQDAIDSSGEANAELEALLDPNNENSALWAIQWQINENDRIALERHQELIEANMQAISALRENRYISLWLNFDAQSTENEYIRLYRSTDSGGYRRINWSIKPGWVGSFQIVAGTNIDTSAFNNVVYMRELYVPNPQFKSFSDKSVGSVLCTITIKPGTAKKETLPISDQSIERSWQTLQSWTVPQDTEVTASARLTFANKTRIADYGLRILVDGSNNTSSSASSTAPLFGHGPRTHSASMNTRRVKAGSVISVQAKADHSNSLNRQITNASFDVTWIDGTDA
ncbi:hypothetical protein [Pasteurella phage PMP-GADVASU-IND]|nr:hypothetical protein [Pasteurella phage PMP-GADVASU-IND]